MKKILTFVLMLFPLLGMAQVFNAYEYGASVVERIAKQQEEQLRNNPTLMRGRMISAIAGGSDAKAFEYADYLAGRYSTSTDWYWLGVLYESGIHVHDLQRAKNCYEKGRNLPGGEACQMRLDDIAAGRLVSAAVVRDYCRQAVAASQAVAPIYDSGSTGSSSSSGSRKSSGTCSRCHGTRIDPVRIDYTPGSSTMSAKIPAYTKCPYCGDTKAIDHWHERCLDCATY